jgi:hypothetical protein
LTPGNVATLIKFSLVFGDSKGSKEKGTESFRPFSKLLFEEIGEDLPAFAALTLALG